MTDDAHAMKLREINEAWSAVLSAEGNLDAAKESVKAVAKQAREDYGIAELQASVDVARDHHRNVMAEQTAPLFGSEDD